MVTNHEQGVPDPLAVVARPAPVDPGVLQGFHGRTEFFQNALIKDPLRRRENLRVIRFEKLRDSRRFCFRGDGPSIQPTGERHPAHRCAAGDFEKITPLHCLVFQ